MKFIILTLFPKMVENFLSYSIMKKAIDSNALSINVVDIRDFSGNKHNQVDDYPYGGGAGMVMTPMPIYQAFLYAKSLCETDPTVIFLSPQGKQLTQKIVREISTESKDIIMLCGHYEGVDERVLEEIVTCEISIGDFILTGGELPALVLLDAISRLLPGVLGKIESCQDESFENGLLEYPHYTRPKEFLGKSVPDVLISGHHKNVEKWRRDKSIERTNLKRPDLIEKLEETIHVE